MGSASTAQVISAATQGSFASLAGLTCRAIELEENQTLEDVFGPPSSAPYVPENRPGPKSGPKGVLADKAAHDKELRKAVSASKTAHSVAGARSCTCDGIFHNTV